MSASSRVHTKSDRVAGIQSQKREVLRVLGQRPSYKKIFEIAVPRPLKVKWHAVVDHVHSALLSLSPLAASQSITAKLSEGNPWTIVYEDQTTKKQLTIGDLRQSARNGQLGPPFENAVKDTDRAEQNLTILVKWYYLCNDVADTTDGDCAAFATLLQKTVLSFTRNAPRTSRSQAKSLASTGPPTYVSPEAFQSIDLLISASLEVERCAALGKNLEPTPDSRQMADAAGTIPELQDDSTFMATPVPISNKEVASGMFHTYDTSSDPVHHSDDLLAFHARIVSEIDLVRLTSRDVPRGFMCQVLSLQEFGCSQRMFAILRDDNEHRNPGQMIGIESAERLEFCVQDPGSTLELVNGISLPNTFRRRLRRPFRLAVSLPEEEDCDSVHDGGDRLRQLCGYLFACKGLAQGHPDNPQYSEENIASMFESMLKREKALDANRPRPARPIDEDSGIGTDCEDQPETSSPPHYLDRPLPVWGPLGREVIQVKFRRPSQNASFPRNENLPGRSLALHSVQSRYRPRLEPLQPIDATSALPLDLPTTPEYHSRPSSVSSVRTFTPGHGYISGVGDLRADGPRRAKRKLPAPEEAVERSVGLVIAAKDKSHDPFHPLDKGWRNDEAINKRKQRR